MSFSIVEVEIPSLIFSLQTLARASILGYGFRLLVRHASMMWYLLTADLILGMIKINELYLFFILTDY
jgi:hypothetical protein